MVKRAVKASPPHPSRASPLNGHPNLNRADAFHAIEILAVEFKLRSIGKFVAGRWYPLVR